MFGGGTMDPEKTKPLLDFQFANPTREEKEEALKHMSNAQIDVLIDVCPNIYGKLFYSKFKKNEDAELEVV